jgi:hypothetical protein
LAAHKISPKLNTYFLRILLLSLILPAWWAVRSQPRSIQATGQVDSPSRRVNVPHLSGASFTPTVFWFGKVDPTSNYADVRLWYYDEQLAIMVNMIDRLVWYDTTSSETDLTKWDAVSVYLDLAGNTGAAPSTNAYLIQSQLGFQASYRWIDNAWEPTSIPIEVETTWRGNSPNDNLDDKGWQVTFTIPFESLGLNGPPPLGTKWGMGIMVHDRDDAGGTAIPDTVWPAAMNPISPDTWGELNFGLVNYMPPPVLPQGEITIRQGLNNAQVFDAHVGGHTTCGEGLDHWTQWGEANYAGYDQINIQNQWDIADYPCFSKYYITFPLDALPSGKTIVSASLQMTLFGNAGGGVWGEAPDSYIEVFSIGEDWVEATLTWNSAPLALENLGGTLVHPRDYDLPDQAYYWDISRAVAEAYAAGEPLRLALYSADGERHTGKYFWSSDVGDWNAEERPTLRVRLGIPCDAPGTNCRFTYVPVISK